jgi:hypothetical protein
MMKRWKRPERSRRRIDPAEFGVFEAMAYSVGIAAMFDPGCIEDFGYTTLLIM